MLLKMFLYFFNYHICFLQTYGFNMLMHYGCKVKNIFV